MCNILNMLAIMSVNGLKLLHVQNYDDYMQIVGLYFELNTKVFIITKHFFYVSTTFSATWHVYFNGIPQVICVLI